MKMPEGWSSDPRLTKVLKQQKVTSGIDMGPETAGVGLCPSCHRPMTPVIANGVKCLCCLDDRIVLPCKNDPKDKLK